MFEKEKEAFEELNRRLRQKEMNLTVICAGGSGLRSSRLGR